MSLVPPGSRRLVPPQSPRRRFLLIKTRTVNLLFRARRLDHITDIILCVRINFMYCSAAVFIGFYFLSPQYLFFFFSRLSIISRVQSCALGSYYVIPKCYVHQWLRRYFLHGGAFFRGYNSVAVHTFIPSAKSAGEIV